MFKQSNFRNYSIYDSDGNAPPVVFMHGLAANAAYGEFLKIAFPEHRIFIPELPGHGNSDEKNTETDVYQIALELRDIFIHHGIEKPVICGHSLGAQIAILYSIIYPEDVSSLLLISPAGLELFADYQKQIILSGWSLGSIFHDMFAPAFHGSEIKELAHLPSSSAVKAYMQSMMDRPVKELLDRVKCKAKILFGTNDPMIPNQMFNPGNPVRFAEKAVEGYSNFEVIPLPGCGHWPMAENPGLLISTIKSLI